MMKRIALHKRILYICIFAVCAAPICTYFFQVYCISDNNRLAARVAIDMETLVDDPIKCIGIDTGLAIEVSDADFHKVCEYIHSRMRSSIITCDVYIYVLDSSNTVYISYNQYRE